MPGDFSGGLSLFVIVFAIALVELYILKKRALFSISGRSPFYGYTGSGEQPTFVGLPPQRPGTQLPFPEEIPMGAIEPMICQSAEGIWQPFNPDEPMSGEGCCAEAMDPDMLIEAEIPLCEDLGEFGMMQAEDYGGVGEYGYAESEDYGEPDEEEDVYVDDRGVSVGGGRVSASAGCACADGECVGDCDGMEMGMSMMKGRGKGGRRRGKGKKGRGHKMKITKPEAYKEANIAKVVIS